MLVTSCMLVIVIQTKCITMLANYPEYFDHAATQPGSVPNDKTMEEFPLPDLKPWATLFPTPTPKPNTTKTTLTTLGLETKFFYVAQSNMSDIFTVTKSTASNTMLPYLTGFVTTPDHKITFPSFDIMSTVVHPTTDIIIPTIIEDNYEIRQFTTRSQGSQYLTKAREVPTLTLPTKVPPITLPTKVPPITLSKKVLSITLPTKVDRIALNSSTSSTMKHLLRVSPTVPTKTNQTVKREAAIKTNTTNPSVTVSSTVKLKANTTNSPINNGLTEVKPNSNNPIPEFNNVTTVKPTTTSPGLNNTANLTGKNETGVPTDSKNSTNEQIPNTTITAFEIVERTPKHEDPTTTPIYEDVIEYEELTTEPFSKFLEQLLFQLAKMDKTYATRFIRNFDRIATLKANTGAFHNFGGVTNRYIQEMLPGLETSTDILQRMFSLGFSNLKSRRKTLAIDTNELLDYMDMMFLPSEEKLMQEILNHTMRYPNTSKPPEEICTEIINGLIIMPSKRLSGTKKGNVLFKSLDNIIVSRHPEYDHHRKNLENKGHPIAAITSPVGNSYRRNFDSFHYSNGRKFKALNHVSKSNRRYDGSIENAKVKKSKYMNLLNKGNRRKWIHDNEDRKQYYRINNALSKETEPTNHGTEYDRSNDGSNHKDKSREIEDINQVNEDERKYDSINYAKDRKSKTSRNFNKSTTKNNSSINIVKNKGNKAISHFNKSKRIKKRATKKFHAWRFGKENLRRSYNTFSGRFQTTGWMSNARERDNNKYNVETNNVFGTFSDSNEFIQSESDDESNEIEIERQRKANNVVFDRIQKLKSRNVIEPVIKTKTVRKQGMKKIKWGLPSWNPNENEFAALRQVYHPRQRRTDTENYLLNNRELLLKKGFRNNKNKFEMFREGRPSSELPFHKDIIKNKNNNNVLRIGQQYKNMSFSAPIKSQFQNNMRPLKKSLVSRQLKMQQFTKRFHNYKPKIEEIGEPNPRILNPMDKTLTNRTSYTFATEKYPEIKLNTYISLAPLETPNNNINNQRNSYIENNKIIGMLNPSNARTNQQVIDFDNSPNIIDFSMKVKLNKPQDGDELVFVNDHYINKVNMRGREAQVTEVTRIWDPYQMDKYFGKTKVTRKDIKKRVYVRKPVPDTSDNTDSGMSQYERDVLDGESEQDESDRYTFKGVKRKNSHSKHHHKYRLKHHKRKNHDKNKHKKHRRDVRQRHGTHKKTRKKHGFRPNTKKRKHGRNKHSHHKNHRYYKNKRGKKKHRKKHAMAIDSIRNRASDTRPIPVDNLFKYEEEESSTSEENSSSSTEQAVGISAPEIKKYKPIGKLMEFDKVSTLKIKNEVENYNQKERAESVTVPKNREEVKYLENKGTEYKHNESKINNRNPKRRGAYVTIGLLMDDMIYRFRENELKRNVYDAFRQNYRRNYRRTMGKEFHPPVLPPLVIREDSVYTDDEAVLKRNIYKAIKTQNSNADMSDQNKPKVLKRKF